VFEHALDFFSNGGRAEDNHVGMCPSWANVAFGHGRNCLLKLFEYRLGCATAFADVAFATALKTDVVRHFDVDSSG
jgi:hypothetical protein